MTEHPIAQKLKKPLQWLLILLAVFAAGWMLSQAIQTDSRETEHSIVSTLKEVVDVSELSTFAAVYNGVAKVMNQQNPEVIDYYVSYEARVDAGVDFDQIEISIEGQTIYVTLPPVRITDVNVDVASLDFIFCNRNANTSAVTQTAFKACEEDVQRESRQEEAIYALAKQNAVNVLTALISPLMEGEAYTLVIE